MGVPSPARTLLILFCLMTFVLAHAAPALGRTPYRMKDAQEGDPGDGVLSPRASEQDAISAPAPDPEPVTSEAQGASASAVGRTGVVLVVAPGHGAWFFPTTGRGWSALLQGWLPWRTGVPDGGWRNAQ